LNKLQDAAGALREAVRLQPDDPLAWYRLGLTCNGMGRFDDEIAAYERAVNLRADFADAWHNLTVAYAKSRQFEKAWNAVRKLEAIDSYRANTLASYLAERSPKSMQARVGLGD
jgi:tetratricopeptide (TPR) repeat protein